MANISKNTFDADKNYQSVIFQIGSPVVDSELNEAQDLRLVHSAEIGWSYAGYLRATDLRVSAFGGVRFGSAIRDHWACTASGTPDITVKAGSLFVDGFNIIAPDDVSLVGEGIDFSSPDADTYGFIYADFVFTEIDSTEDPNIAQEQVGETTRRIKLGVTFGKAESTTSYAAAHSGMTDLAADDYDEPEARLWKGNVARVFLCRYFRASGSSNISQSNLVDLRQDVPGEAANKHTFLKTIRDGNADGMISWDLANGYLQIGINTGESSPTGMKNGIVLTTAGSPDLYASQSADLVWTATGAGNADGVQRLPLGSEDFSFGWLLSDGDALGYSAAGSAYSATSGFPRKKEEFLETGGRTSLYDADANSLSFTPAPLSVQKLVIQALDYFVGDPSVFVICTRKGDDILWFDGTVTRGNAEHPVFEELGGTPTPYSAVIGNEGRNHLTKNDAVERALNYLSSFSGDEDLGSNRSVRLFIRRGVWDFARGVHKYGTSTEVAAFTDGYDVNSNSIVLEGSGAKETKLQFRNPYTPDRTSTDHAVVTFAANEVIVRGLTFSQTYSGTTFLGSYYAFFGRTVVLEDCIFEGPIWIKADTLRIKNCRFNSLGNSGDSVLQPSLWLPTGFVAQHALLQPFGAADNTSSCTWDIEGCTFNSTVSIGTQACVELALTEDSTENLRARIVHNVWSYANNGNDSVPAVNIGGTKGSVEIGHNRFVGAGGVAKAGNTTVSQTVPFNELYGGAPIMRYANDDQMYATGYISAVRGRSRTSRLHVHDNYFDLSRVGEEISNIYAMWGGVMCVFNYLTSGSSDTIEYHNISVEKNDFLMRNEVGWNDGDGNPQPATWGFWLSPTFQGGQSLNNVQVENIAVNGNNFDIGGESSANAEFCWRGILAGQITAWPATGAHLTDSSYLIGIQLKNTNAVAGNVHTGRNGQGIEVSYNRICQRRDTGQSDYLQGAINGILAMSTASIRWQANLILIDGGGLPLTSTPITPTVADVGGVTLPRIPSSPANAGLLFSPRVSNNSVFAPVYSRSEVGTVTHGNAAIDIVGAYAPIVDANVISLSHLWTTGIALRGCIHGIVSNNIVLAYNGCYSGDVSYVGNNVFKLSSNKTAGSPDVLHEVASSNFET